MDINNTDSQQQVVTVPYQPPTETTNCNLPAIDEENTDPDSIWNQERFPAKTKPIEFTPKQLREALDEYADTLTPLTELMRSKGIDRNTFFKLSGLYPEISAAYSTARLLKAHKFGEVIENTFTDLPDREEFYVYDKEGNKSLSAAGVNYLKVRSDNMHRIAIYHETGSFIPLSKQETTNRNLNVGVQLNGSLPSDFDISTAAPGQLVDALKGRKRV